MTSFSLICLLKAYLQLQSQWELGLQCMNLGGYNSVHSTSKEMFPRKVKNQHGKSLKAEAVFLHP